MRFRQRIQLLDIGSTSLSNQAQRADGAPVPAIDVGTLRSLHARLSVGDSGAGNDVARYLLDRLCRIVACQVHGVEPGLINDAVEDSLLRYCHHPESYDPGRSRLDVFLALVAKRKLIDLLRHEKRRKALDAAFAASVAQTFDPRIIALPTPSPEAPDVRRLADHWSEPDRKFLEARLQGERRTRILAAILGLPLAPWVLQRQAVKRATDRLRVRLRRQLAQAQLGYRR